MKKKVLIILSIVAVIAIGALVCFLLLFNKTYTIKFDSDGGSTVKNIKVKSGKTIKLPEATKDGYTLEGWYNGSTKVDNNTKYKKNTTLKAKWIERAFKVTFDSKGGSAVEPINVECGKELTLPAAPTRSGYTFGHWEDQNETPILDQALLSCEDVTLYAVWEVVPQGAPANEPKTFKVTFDSKGGSAVTAIYVECGKALKLPANPTKSGYKFGHWEDKNGTTVLDQSKLTCNDVTLYATWDAAYTCPYGYTLNRTKCTMTKDPTMVCPSGTKEDGNVCIKVTEKVTGTRTCGKKTVHFGGGHTEEVQGVLHNGPGNSYTQCYYGLVTDSYENNQSNCTSRSHKWNPGDSKCYVEMDTNYSTACSSPYVYYSSTDLFNKFGAHDGGGCYRSYSKEAKCDSDYTLTNGKCVKTVAAIKK